MFSGLDSDARGFSLSLDEDQCNVDVDESTLIIQFRPRNQFYQMFFAYLIYPKTHPFLTFTEDDTPDQGAGSYRISGPIEYNRANRLKYHQFRI